MMKSKMQKNIYINLISNGFLIVFGIVVPRIFITSYGSDVNGLLSTLTQIFTYLALMEAGIGQAAKNAMYKPMTEHDYDGVSYYASIAARYYKKISVYYSIGVIILAAVCPFILKTNINRMTVFLVIIIEGASNVVTYYFNSFYTYFLAADGKSYINNEINVIVTLMTYVSKIILALAGINIVFLQVAYFCIRIVLVFVYRHYFRKNYAWLDLKRAPKNKKLKDRGSYAIEAVSWLAFSSTDMIVLSTFVSTTLSSVYAVYTMIFNCLNTLINSVYTGVNYKLSQTYHENIERYKDMHNVYTSVFFGGMTILLCTAYILILPFMTLYVGHIPDAQYVNASLPVLFCLIQLLSWSRYVMGNLAGVAGYQKQQGNVSIIEAAINIVLSVVVVQFYGIVGVLVASVVALPIKIVYLTWLCEVKILNRSPRRYLCILGVNFVYFAFVVFIKQFFELSISNYGYFIIYGFVTFAICAVIGVAINVAVNPSCIRIVKILRSKEE